MPDEFSNIVKVSGEILGEDTYDRIIHIGNKHGLLTLTDGLIVMYRKSKPSFTVK
jgi:hypothetical protein